MVPVAVRRWTIRSPLSIESSIHRAKLDGYQADLELERRPDVPRRGQRTVEHWRGETLRMGLLYEEAAVTFWTDVASNARAASGDGDR